MMSVVAAREPSPSSPSPAAWSEVILQADLVEFDALVGLLEAGVRQVLVAIADVVGVPRAEAQAEPDVIAELELGAEAPLRAHRGVREQMQADSCLEIRCERARTRLLQ